MTMMMMMMMMMMMIQVVAKVGFGDNCNEVVIEEKDEDNLDGNRNECKVIILSIELF